MTQAGITQLVNTIKRGYRKESYNRVMRRIWNDGIRLYLHIINYLKELTHNFG